MICSQLLANITNTSIEQKLFSQKHRHSINVRRKFVHYYCEGIVYSIQELLVKQPSKYSVQYVLSADVCSVHSLCTRVPGI